MNVNLNLLLLKKKTLFKKNIYERRFVIRDRKTIKNEIKGCFVSGDLTLFKKS